MSKKNRFATKTGQIGFSYDMSRIYQQNGRIIEEDTNCTMTGQYILVI